MNTFMPHSIHILTLICCFLFINFPIPIEATSISLGIDQLFTPEYQSVLRGKQIGLITNHTAVNTHLQPTCVILKNNASLHHYTLQALFAPEHGLMGNHYASEKIESSKDLNGIPIYSLYGKTCRPTKEMLQSVNLLIYDIQDIGTRSYTYISTLFYVMEEAAKLKIPLLVLDRPNPINGYIVDGPMLEEKWRSIVGYVNVPYCHGMTVGELALFFNAEYQIGCPLTIIPMKGWKRKMTFQDTGLQWIPTSPQIPASDTAFYYPMTGIIGELQLVNIGVGYTLPFKVIGAPWINASDLAQRLNTQKLPGVFFHPFYYRPFFGRYAQEDCNGILIVVTNPLTYQPVSTQYFIMGLLKSLYPQPFQKALTLNKNKEEMFHKINGTAEVYRILKEEKYAAWTLKALHQKERIVFLNKRKKYLLPDYE